MTLQAAGHVDRLADLVDLSNRTMRGQGMPGREAHGLNPGILGFGVEILSRDVDGGHGLPGQIPFDGWVVDDGFGGQVAMLDFPGAQELVDVLGRNLLQVLFQELELLQADVQQLSLVM